MKIKELAIYLERLEKTPSRIEITKILSELFKKSEADEIDKITYLILGNLAPGFRGEVFNIAEKLMLQIIAKTYGIEKDATLKLYKDEGDLGNVAAFLALSSKIKVQNSNLSINQVYEKLLELAKDEGEKSVERKVESMSLLLLQLDPLSAKYVARIPVGRLRLGFSDKTILDALSWMETGGKDKKAKLEEAFNILPDVGLLAKAVKEKGIDKAVLDISPELGIPLLPMLAARLKSTTEMIAKMNRVYVEPKFDGLRIQIHFKKAGFEGGQKVKAFTRNLNETSWMFPELTDIGRFINADEVILDTEAVGVDEVRKTMANFQTTMTRRRKHNIGDVSKKVSITFNVFDVMFKNGKSLVHEPYWERRRVLSGTILSSGGNKLLRIVDFEETDSPEKIDELMKKELKEGLEGVVVKRADSKYIAGRTGYRWVKMKEKESQKAKLADTVDCIVMGYSAGRGKRVSFGLGQFLVGIRDGDDFKTITKVGTGLTDEQFRELKRRLLGSEVKEKPKEYLTNKLQEPDFWVDPKVVVEIAADEITKSPSHTSGYALRFPRLVKFRDDKSIKEVTTLNEIIKMTRL